MATTAPPAPPAGTMDASHAAIVNQQIERARRSVKRVELFSSGMLFIASALGYLLLAVLIDHWVMPLNSWMRGLLLVGFVVGAAAYFWFRFLPLLLRPINPLYAARSMERSAQTLKNSLLNFLFLRQDRAGVHDAVYTTIQQRAAADLTSPNIDTTIDMSKAMRIAYILIAVLALSAAYTILAPKSALQSLARVVNPWTSVAAPTRVAIDSVEPGDVEVYYGEYVELRVAVSGLGDEDPVLVRYSTADLQTVDEPIGLERTSDGLYYTAKLPPNDDGIQQDLTYFVEAGDARSERFQVTTNAAPSIIVDKVVYDFPEYTGFKQRVELRQGDVRAIEGARVTIHAHANRDIRSAAIEFNTDAPGEASEKMQVEGRQATASFILGLNAQGEPERKTYQLRFFDEQGKKNPNPIPHQIHVTRDYPPVVEILRPELRRIEVPLDASEEIEVRAVDPDFALQRIRLKMVVGESEVFSQSRERPQRGQVVERFAFSPSRLKLTAGDVVMYRAYAEDNRADLNGSPLPNEERTEEYSIVITAARKQASSEGGANSPESKPDADSNAQQDASAQSDDSPMGNQESESGADPAEGGEPQDGEQSGDGEKGTGDDKGGGDEGKRSGEDENGTGQSKDPQNSKRGDGDNSDGDPNATEPGDGAGDGDKKTESGQGGESGDNPQPSPQSGDMGETPEGAQKPGEGDPNAANSQGSDGATSGGQQTQSGDSGNAPQGQTDGEGSPTGPADQSRPPNEGGADGGTDGQGAPGQTNKAGGPANPGQGEPDLTNAQPNDEPLQDGEAIETIKEHIDRNRGQRTGERLRAEDQSNPDSAANKTRSEGAAEGGQRADPNSAPMQSDANDPKREGKTQSQENPETAGSPNAQNPGGDARGQDASGAGDNTASDKPGQGPQDADAEPPQDNDTPRGDNGNLGAGKQADGAKGASGNPTNGQKQAANDPAAEPGEQAAGGQGDQGDSGDGQKAESPQGAPMAEGRNQDRNKTGQPDGQGEPSPNGEPPAPTSNPKQSDSKGGEGGDRSGGGKQGGGQSGQQEGNDSAGSQSAGDEGAGAAQESGQGDNSASGGNKQPANSPTGVAGEQEGEGSQTKSGAGDETGGAPPMNADARNQSRSLDGKSSSGQAGNGGGVAPEQAASNRGGPAREVADSGDGNREFAEQATDLALDYLKHNPDDKALMDKLGWSEADRKRFVDRWSQLKRSAKEGSEGRRRLDDALEGLGLRKGSDAIRRQSNKSDGGGGLRQDGAGPANLPAHLLERFNAYKRGAAKSRD